MSFARFCHHIALLTGALLALFDKQICVSTTREGITVLVIVMTYDMSAFSSVDKGPFSPKDCNSPNTVYSLWARVR